VAASPCSLKSYFSPSHPETRFPFLFNHHHHHHHHHLLHDDEGDFIWD